MAEIGETLRDARMRARIDISEIETQTKIRAKYLRAIENEEWDLLPGPTYVKSFLRTYAEALGLDARMLVEEYKLRHERLADDQLRPIGPPGPARTRRGSSGPPRLVILGVIVALLLGALWVVGSTGDPEPEPVPTVAATATAPAPPAATTPAASARPPRPRTVQLQIIATDEVYVCLEAADGRVLVPGEVLQAGQRTRTFRSRRFSLTLGNSRARLRVNGRPLTVPPSADAIGYRITPAGRRSLPAGARPECT